MQINKNEIEQLIDFLSQKGACQSVTTLPKKILWGVAPTGDIHLGYLAYIAILDKLKSLGVKVTILIANHHAYLDSKKTEWELLDERAMVYRETFKGFGFNDKEIIETRNIYTSRNYIEGFYRFSYFLPNRGMLEAANTTLKSSSYKEYKFSDSLYVALQIYDIHYFNIDIVLCGIDESGIYEFGLPIVQKNTNKKINYIYLPMMPGTMYKEMHASDSEDNKICLWNFNHSIEDKLSLNNELLSMYKNFVIPLCLLNKNNKYNSFIDVYKRII